MTFYDKIITPQEQDNPTKFPLFLRISQIPPQKKPKKICKSRLP